MKVSKPKPIIPQRNHGGIEVRFIGETVPLFAHPRQQLDQSALLMHLFTTGYERQICLLANATTTKSARTAPVIPSYGPSRDSHVTTLAETIPHLQNKSGTAGDIRTQRTADASRQGHCEDDCDPISHLDASAHPCHTKYATDCHARWNQKNIWRAT